jgi:hypothetical protein
VTRPCSIALVLSLAGLLAGCGGQSPSRPHAPAAGWNHPAPPFLPLRIGPDLVVKRVRFGIVKNTPSGDDEFVPADVLPAEDGITYGWVADLETTRPSVRWQERLTLPQPSDDWGDAEDDDGVLISQDGRTALSTGDDLVDKGQMRHVNWLLGTGDPPGRYVMDVAIEGHPVAHFEFRLEQPVHEKPMLVRYPRRTGAMPAVRAARTDGGTTWK